jgi:microcystin degradation protein MlrC
VKLFIAALATETNTFSPIRTGRAAFVKREFFRDGWQPQAAAARQHPVD